MPSDAIDLLFDWQEEREKVEVGKNGSAVWAGRRGCPPREITEEELASGLTRKCRKCERVYPETVDFYRWYKYREHTPSDGYFRRTKGRWDTICFGCHRKRKKRHARGLKARGNAIKGRAVSRGIEWGFDDREDLRKFYDTPCHYCGGEVEQRLGLDRVDNAKGYIPGNVVQCCLACTRAKSTHSVDEWVAHMERVLDHLNHRSVSEEPTPLRRNDAESVPERTLFL